MSTLHFPRVQGLRRLGLILVSACIGFSEVRGQTANDNPTGPTGQFNGNITTAGNYDPYTGNSARTVIDLEISGTLGKYGLSWSRTWNSREGYDWRDSYSWRVGSVCHEASQGTNYDRVIYFPDGRVVNYGRAKDAEGYYQAKAGIPERLREVPGPGYITHLLLSDGGKVEFRRTGSFYTEGDPGETVEYVCYSYALQAIIDPHGLRTTVTWPNGTLKITEPGGRWIQAFYPSGRLDYIQASDGRRVDYTYETRAFAPGAYSYKVLTGVTYFGDANLRAVYTYRAPNVGSTNGRPLLASCIDPMFGGPMKEISYTYATTNNPDGTSPVFGQIRSENHRATGTPVSTLTINNWDTRTETRGDGPSRSFTYLTGKLASWRDFKGVSMSQTRDAAGYVNSLTDRRNNRTDFVREPLTGNLTLMTHPLTPFDGGVRPTVQIVYGSASCPDVNNRDGNNPYYVHKIKNERGHWTTYWRDPNKRVTRIDYPNGGYESFTYNSFGQVLSHRMTSGGSETFAYDTRGLLQTRTPPATPSDSNPGAHPTRYFYYTSGPQSDRLQRVQDPRGYSTWYEYNMRGQVTKVTHPDGHTIVNAYNSDGTLRSVADELKHTTSFAYDDYKRVTSVTNPLNQTTLSNYSPWGGTGAYSHTSGSAYWTQTPAGKETHFGFDDNLRHRWVKQAPGVAGEEATTNYAYDGNGNLLSVQDPRGNVTTYAYDQRNRRTSATDPAPFNNQVTRWEYDAIGNLKKEIRADGKFRFLEYESMNRLWKDHDEMDRVTVYEYFPSGMVKSVTDPKQQKTQFTYDARNLKETMTYPDLSVVQRWKYDAAGNMIERPTADSTMTQLFRYDERNRVQEMRWSNAIDFADFAYDSASRLTLARNPYSTVTREYDDAGRLTLDRQILAGIQNTPAITVQPSRVVSRQVHGAAGAFDIDLPLTGDPGIECRTGGSSHNYTLVLTFPSPVTMSGAAVSSGTGTVTSATATGSEVTVNLTAVSNAQRVTVKVYGLNDGTDTGEITVPMHVLVADVNASGRVDGADVMLVRNANFQTVTTSNFRADVNASGRIDGGDVLLAQNGSLTTLPSAPLPGPQVDVARGYDDDGNANQLFVPSSSPSPYDFGFGYDSRNRLEKIYGAPPSTCLDGCPRPLHYQYFYDVSSNVKERRNYLNPSSQTFEWDELNRVEERVINAVAYDNSNTLAPYQFSHEYYGYDLRSRLELTDRRLRWSRDGAIERTGDTFDYNDAGELTAAGYGLVPNAQGQFVNPARAVTYQPDTAGNRLSVNTNGTTTGYTPNNLNQYGETSNGSEHEIAGYAGVSYRYIADTRLARVSSATGGTYELGYDALGRTVKRVTNGVPSYYAFDGERPILEYDGSGTITATTVYGLGIDEIIARENNGNAQFLHQDRLGNVSAVTNSLGQVVEQYRYDAFGAPEIRGAPVSGNASGALQSGTLVNNRFLFTGREWVARFGFYEYRARAYHPGLGRFMSEDPIGFAAGDTNLFSYCAGDPVNKTDPSGLVWRPPVVYNAGGYAPTGTRIPLPIGANLASAGNFPLGFSSTNGLGSMSGDRFVGGPGGGTMGFIGLTRRDAGRNPDGSPILMALPARLVLGGSATLPMGSDPHYTNDRLRNERGPAAGLTTAVLVPNANGSVTLRVDVQVRRDLALRDPMLLPREWQHVDRWNGWIGRMNAAGSDLSRQFSGSPWNQGTADAITRFLGPYRRNEIIQQNLDFHQPGGPHDIDYGIND